VEGGSTKWNGFSLLSPFIRALTLLKMEGFIPHLPLNTTGFAFEFSVPKVKHINHALLSLCPYLYIIVTAPGNS
jgi:hypothetical protein